jgi:hypothetical protein
VTQLSARFYLNNAMADLARAAPSRRLLQAFAKNLVAARSGQTAICAKESGLKREKSVQLKPRPKNTGNVTK